MARILIVSYRFPPFQSIGALAVGKTAKYLVREGHDVRVLSADDQPLPRSLSVEVPGEFVVRTPWLEPLRPIQRALGGRERVAAQGYVSGLRHRSVASWASAVYRATL